MGFCHRICPVENVSSSRRRWSKYYILGWYQQTLVTLMLQITTDSWPSEISWNLVSAAGTELFSTAPGDMSVAAEIHTWDIDIEQGAYFHNI